MCSVFISAQPCLKGNNWFSPGLCFLFSCPLLIMSSVFLRIHVNADTPISYCRVAQSLALTYYSNIKAFSQGMRAKISCSRHQKQDEKKKRIASLHCWLPSLYGHTWSCDICHVMHFCLHHWERCPFSQLSEWVCCMNWQGYLRKLLPCRAHRVVHGCGPEPLSTSAC